LKNPSNRALNVVVVSNSQVRDDILSGGDRIFIECAKRWAGKGQNIQVITCQVGHKMCRRYGLDNVQYIIMPSGPRKLSLYLLYILTMVRGCMVTPRMPQGENIVIYSSSDFWPDSIPAWFLKIS
jgi:hypothetical protein